MVKIYRMKTGKLIICFLFMGVLLIFSFWQLFLRYSELNIIQLLFYCAVIFSAVYLMLNNAALRYAVSTGGIKQETFKLFFTPREISWEDIRIIVCTNVHNLGSRTYYLNPDAPSKQRINIGSSIKDSRELITEIVERAPRAYLDDEVKRVIAEYKESIKGKE